MILSFYNWTNMFIGNNGDKYINYLKYYTLTRRKESRIYMHILSVRINRYKSLLKKKRLIFGRKKLKNIFNETLGDLFEGLSETTL